MRRSIFGSSNKVKHTSIQFESDEHLYDINQPDTTIIARVTNVNDGAPELPLIRDNIQQDIVYYVKNLSDLDSYASVLNVQFHIEKDAGSLTYNTLCFNDCIIKCLFVHPDTLIELKAHIIKLYAYANLFILDNMLALYPDNWKYKNNEILCVPSKSVIAEEFISRLIQTYDVQSVITTLDTQWIKPTHAIGVDLQSVKQINIQGVQLC